MKTKETHHLTCFMYLAHGLWRLCPYWKHREAKLSSGLMQNVLYDIRQ